MGPMAESFSLLPINKGMHHIMAIFLLCSYCIISTAHGARMSAEEKANLRRVVKEELFQHGYDSYMRHAFPMDDLRPVSCTGVNTHAGYALTLLDTLDTLLVLGNVTEFEKAVKWVIENTSFEIDKYVSVFETNIRVLGGLLSAHVLATEDILPWYKGELLALAIDIAERMLPAFDTPTGIPYGSINLIHGVSRNETAISSVAGGGTHIIEFGVLSKLTGDPRYEMAARNAAKAIWKRRSPLGLLGNHINIRTGEWSHDSAVIGGGADSYYEYLLKGAILFNDQEYLDMFLGAYSAVMAHLRRPPWYVDVSMQKGFLTWAVFNSLQAFWPGMQVLIGDVDIAGHTLNAMHSVWTRYGFTPEIFNLQHMDVQTGHETHPLRPEMAESAYMLYGATGSDEWLEIARNMVHSLLTSARTECGFATIGNVHTHHHRDHMESFFLSETCKYLYLIFDESNKITAMTGQWIFSTEAHVFPVSISGPDPHLVALYADNSMSSRLLQSRHRWKYQDMDAFSKKGALMQTCSVNNETEIDDVSARPWVPLAGASMPRSYFERLSTPELPLVTMGFG